MIFLIFDFFQVKELSAKFEFESKLPKVSQAVNGTNSAKDINERLKELINASEAMLFMKGSPGAPECGFSRQTVELLNDINADFGYFDILRDNEVRELNETEEMMIKDINELIRYRSDRL